MNESIQRLIDEGVSLFNRQQFFEAHEIWEDAWRQEEGDSKRFLQGLIQVAAGFVKLQRHQPRGAASLLSRGAEKLAGIPSERYGLEFAPWLESISAWQASAHRDAESGREEPHSLNHPLLKPLKGSRH